MRGALASVWIMESSIPDAAAVVAAPVRELCSSILVLRQARYCISGQWRVASRSVDKEGRSPLVSMYWRIAVTCHEYQMSLGHVEFSQNVGSDWKADAWGVSL